MPNPRAWIGGAEHRSVTLRRCSKEGVTPSRFTRHNLGIRAEPRQRDTVKPLELFFDLVFVLGFTQCSALMATEPSWVGLLRGCMALALLWWAWAGYAWLTSVIDPEEGSVRIVMFVAMSALVVAALAVPESFGARGLTFALAYGVVRIAHLALFLVSGRDDAGLRRTVLEFGTTSAVAIALLVVGSFLDPSAQTALWALAIVTDLAGGLIGIGGWSLMPTHFAERHNLVIILALGESIIALGVGTHVALTAPVTVASCSVWRWRRRCGGSTSTSSPSSPSNDWSGQRPVANGTAMPGTATPTSTCSW
jgi:low temperature requirement protein LtrA